MYRLTLRGTRRWRARRILAIAALALLGLVTTLTDSTSSAWTGADNNAANTLTTTTWTNPATQLAFTTPPGDIASPGALVPQPVVTVEDVNGSTVATSVPVTLTISGGTVSCSVNPVTSVNGVATFSGCTVSAAGTYTLTATSGSLAQATSAQFTVGDPSAKKLVISVPAGINYAYLPFNTGASNVGDGVVTVTAQNAAGATVASPAVSVSLSAANSGGTAVAGDIACASGVTATTVNGVATFTGCRINQTGTPAGGTTGTPDTSTYNVTAASSPLTPAVGSVTVENLRWGFINYTTTCAGLSVGAPAPGPSYILQWNTCQSSGAGSNRSSTTKAVLMLNDITNTAVTNTSGSDIAISVAEDVGLARPGATATPNAITLPNGATVTTQSFTYRAPDAFVDAGAEQIDAIFRISAPALPGIVFGGTRLFYYAGKSS
ncbi:hypothetical protein SAMN05444157_2297 [Frankineae bacterium MT45]|nr:hypothetical protein SAMN05444157_2297 [Frankineae bacterium MT45]